MGPVDLSAGQASLVGFTLARGSPDVKWIRADSPAYLPPPMLKSAQQRAERTNALIVIVLTLACTALSVLDLFMLATAS